MTETGLIAMDEFLPDRETAANRFRQIAEFQALARNQMRENVDFGKIPGTTKPTLLKPGAEKIAKLLGLADTYEIVSETEDWTKGFFAYKVRCLLTRMGTDFVVSSGLGECNSMESKYRWRWVWSDDLPNGFDKAKAVTRKVKRDGSTQYRLDNDDIYSQVNTVLKMAKKRALVDAALSAGRLSEVFTQDIEDFERPPVDEEADKSTSPTQARSDMGSGGDAPMGLCPVHKVPFVERTGPRGKFWACPERPGGQFCKERPKDPPPVIPIPSVSASMENLVIYGPEAAKAGEPPVSSPEPQAVPMPVITNWGDLFTWATKKRDQGGLGYANREAVAVALGFKTADALYKSQKALPECVAELLKLAKGE